MCDQYAAQFEAFLGDRLFGADPKARQTERRFAQSLDILFGKKRVYSQEPRYYYFPELPQIQFYDRNDFPWLDALEAATADIRDELIEVMLRTCNGRLTAAEALGHREFVLTRLYESA